MRIHANLQAGAAEVQRANRRRKPRRAGKNTRTLSSSFRCVTRAQRDELRKQYGHAGAEART